jgi:hypothetical protein
MRGLLEQVEDIALAIADVNEPVVGPGCANLLHRLGPAHRFAIVAASFFGPLLAGADHLAIPRPQFGMCNPQHTTAAIGLRLDCQHTVQQQTQAFCTAFTPETPEPFGRRMIQIRQPGGVLNHQRDLG